MSAKPPRILAIAGSDSSGGAGIQADIKTITILGGYAMTAITAVTAQNTIGVQAVEVHSPEFIATQIESCVSDIGVDAVKIGMLGSPDIANTVAKALSQLDVPIVFDPVMVATSGSVLANEATIAAFESLMRMATVVTPNLPELEALGGLETVRSQGCPVLAKGGHSDGETLTDTLYQPGQEPITWSNPRIDTRHTHGTGCTLSSAIATGLGAGLSLEDATARGIAYVREAISNAPGLGKGNGPLGHQAVKLESYPSSS